MIQDIAPHTWDITYKNIQPDPDSRVLFFSRGQLLVQQESDKPADESNQDIHQISFPRYEDIKAECPDAKYQYLFTLDDTAFFRVALSHADKMHILEVTGGKFINQAGRGRRGAHAQMSGLWQHGLPAHQSGRDSGSYKWR